MNLSKSRLRKLRAEAERASGSPWKREPHRSISRSGWTSNTRWQRFPDASARSRSCDYYLGLDIEETAATLEVSTGTVKTCLFRARRALATALGETDPECDVLCTPFDAADLDGNGTEELVVASHFSIMSYYLFAVRPGEEGSLQVEPIQVADPGHAPAGITAGEPLRIDAGGDEGYGSSIRCEIPAGSGDRVGVEPRGRR